MKVIEGLRYRIKRYKERPEFWNKDGKMDKYQGQIVTIYHHHESNLVSICEDHHQWSWLEEDFEEIEPIYLPDVLFEI